MWDNARPSELVTGPVLALGQLPRGRQLLVEHAHEVRGRPSVIVSKVCAAVPCWPSTTLASGKAKPAAAPFGGSGSPSATRMFSTLCSAGFSAMRAAR